MKQLFFYENIVPLNRELHKNLRLAKSRADAQFAADTHYVPVTGVEFEHAARDYPILFTGSGDEGGPILLLGLAEGKNPFINAEGKWRADTYVPAFVRRYPFVLAHDEEASEDGASEAGEGSGGGRNYKVCIDDTCPAFNEEEGEPLFDEEGNDSTLLQTSISFLNQYLADVERTRDFYQRLLKLDVLVPRDLQIVGRNGQYYTLKDFRFVDAGRVSRLEDAEIARLQRDGHMAWIHAHLISLGNLGRINNGASQSQASGGGGEEASEEQADKEQA